MTLVVQTARMGYRGADWLDVTRGTAKSHGPGGHLGIGTAFAPSPKLLRWALDLRDKGQLTDVAWDNYVHDFTAEMRQSYRDRRPAWDTLLSRERVVLLCFCQDAERCHRTVLARELLPRLGAEYAGELARP